MSDSQADRLKGSTRNDVNRAERLAAELRRNLQRRKERSRAVAARQAGDDARSAEGPDEPSGSTS
jgi:hypothetical protein